MVWAITEFESKTPYGSEFVGHVLTHNGRPLWVTDRDGMNVTRVNEDRVPATWEPRELKGKLTNGKVKFWTPMLPTAAYFTHGPGPHPANPSGEQDFIAFAQLYESFSPIEDRVPVEVDPRVFSFRRKSTYGTVAFLPGGGIGAVYRGTNMQGPLKADFFSDSSFFGRFHYADANVRAVLSELGVKGITR